MRTVKKMREKRGILEGKLKRFSGKDEQGKGIGILKRQRRRKRRRWFGEGKNRVEDCDVY